MVVPLSKEVPEACRLSSANPPVSQSAGTKTPKVLPSHLSIVHCQSGVLSIEPAKEKKTNC